MVRRIFRLWLLRERVMFGLFLGMTFGSVITGRWEVAAWQFATTAWYFNAVSERCAYDVLADAVDRVVAAGRDSNPLGRWTDVDA